MVVLAMAPETSLQKQNQIEIDKVKEHTQNGGVVDEEVVGLSSLTTKGEIEALRYSEISALDDEFAEFKYQNLQRLMSSRIDTLDPYQLEMIVQQILSELPEMVSAGQIHPFDATFAHTQAVSRQGNKLQGFEVEALKRSYAELYPYPINSSLLDLH